VRLEREKMREIHYGMRRASRRRASGQKGDAIAGKWEKAPTMDPTRRKKKEINGGKGGGFREKKEVAPRRSGSI